MATKLVTELVPGDSVPFTRTVTETLRTTTSIKVTYDDGTVDTHDLAGDPAVEVLAVGETTAIVAAPETVAVTPSV